LGFGVGLTTPHSKKLIVTKVEKRKSWMDLTMMERVGDRLEKMERIFFDRPKPTVGCSANGRRRRRRRRRRTPFIRTLVNRPPIIRIGFALRVNVFIL
jgi:hypothetical protein